MIDERQGGRTASAGSTRCWREGGRAAGGSARPTFNRYPAKADPYGHA